MSIWPSRLLYGDGSDRFKECFKRWRGMLRNSRGAAVIEELSQLQWRVPAAG